MILVLVDLYYYVASVKNVELDTCCTKIIISELNACMIMVYDF